MGSLYIRHIIFTLKRSLKIYHLLFAFSSLRCPKDRKKFDQADLHRPHISFFGGDWAQHRDIALQNQDMNSMDNNSNIRHAMERRSLSIYCRLIDELTFHIVSKESIH